MVANELTMAPDALGILRAAAALLLFLLPGFLAARIFYAKTGLSFLETAVSSVLLSLFTLAFAASALVFSFGLNEFSLFLTLACIVAIEALYLKK